MSTARRTDFWIVTLIAIGLLGIIGVQAYRANDKAPSRSMAKAFADASKERDAAVMRAHLTMLDGSKVADHRMDGTTFWPPRKGEPNGLPFPLDRDAPARGLSRTAFTSFDWTGVELDPKRGGAPARMMELAEKQAAVLAESGFMLVNAFGWSAEEPDGPRPQWQVTRARKTAGGGGQGGYYFIPGARRMVHVRIYAGRTHDSFVTIRQEFDSKTMTLNVESYSSHPGDATKPIRLIMTETGEVKE